MYIIDWCKTDCGRCENKSSKLISDQHSKLLKQEGEEEEEDETE
jgi:hypothetical protein